MALMKELGLCLPQPRQRICQLAEQRACARRDVTGAD